MTKGTKVISEKNQQIPQTIIKIDEFINVINKLAQILHKENMLLVNMQISEIEAFYEEKSKLVEYLEICNATFAKFPEMVKSFDKDKLNTLKERYLNMQELLQENVKLLGRAADTNIKVIEIVKSVCLENEQKLHGYDSKGAYGVNEMPLSIPGLAIKDTA